MISIAVVALLFILLVVFCVLSAKQWHWANIVFLILCFIAGVAATSGLAKVLKERRAAMDVVKKSEMELDGLSKDADSDGIDDAVDVDVTRGRDEDGDGIDDGKPNIAVANQLDFITYGPPDTLSYSPNSLRGLDERLEILMDGRGRIWANGESTADGTNRRFTFAEARPIVNDDEERKALSLDGAELYAFLDREIDGQSYPTDFIATVRVVEDRPDSLKLEPIFIASQQSYDQDGNWSLYEKMPMDRHDTFSNMANVDITAESFSISDYRAELETQLVRADDLGFDINNADADVAREEAIAYERFIDRICFDGLSIGKIEEWIRTNQNRISGDFSPAPEEVFVKYQFNANPPPESEYIVDAEGNIQALGAFTKSGQANDKALHIGKPVRFAKDDVVLIDQLNATGYTRSNGQAVAPFDKREPVDKIDEIFVRKLFDFPHLLRDHRVHASELDKQTQLIAADMVITQSTVDDLEDQERVRGELITRLTEDGTNLTQDLQIIRKLLDDRRLEAESLQKQISDLEATIARRRAMLDQ